MARRGYIPTREEFAAAIKVFLSGAIMASMRQDAALLTTIGPQAGLRRRD